MSTIQILQAQLDAVVECRETIKDSLQDSIDELVELPFFNDVQDYKLKKALAAIEALGE